MSIKKAKMYTPLQLLIITVCGGPAGAVYALATNSATLDDSVEATVTIVAGGLIALIYLLALPFLPTVVALLVLPAIVAAVAFVLAKRTLAPERTRKILHHFERQTPANIAVVTAASLISSVAFMFVWVSVWRELRE